MCDWVNGKKKGMARAGGGASHEVRKTKGAAMIHSGLSGQLRAGGAVAGVGAAAGAGEGAGV